MFLKTRALMKSNSLQRGRYLTAWMHRDWEVPRMMDLVLVRHGESEGNVAFNRSKAGDHSLYSGEFLRRHSSQWRLTEVGRDQAASAGKYLKEAMNQRTQDRGEPFVFDRHYVSEYIRAQETAARLELPTSRWFSEVFLRERDWGQMDLMSWGERVEKMGSELRRKDLDRFLFAPPGGESMADVAFRSNSIIAQLHRECADRRVIIVCHGEVMWAMRTRLERMSLRRYRDLTASRRTTDHIHNGQILWYTRRNPETGEVSPFFSHFMSVCPWDLSRSQNQWEEIHRQIYTNGMLLAMAEQIPRLINHSMKPDTGEGVISVSKVVTEESEPPSFADGIGYGMHGTDSVDSVKSEDSSLSSTSAQTSQQDSKAASSPAAPSATTQFEPLLPTFSAALHIRPASQQLETEDLWHLEKGKPMDIKKALIVDKTTRYEMERDHYNIEGEDLKRELTIRGMVYDNVKRSYDAHRLARENITNSLARAGIEVNVVKAGKVLPSDLTGVDIIFAAGGDGTFLRAAQAVVGDIPVLGVNTDPSLSQGALTCCKLDLTGGRHPEFDRIIRRVQEGDYRTMYHDRLVVKIVNAEGQETILPQFVLNEVLLTVTDPAKPTVLDIGIDDFEREKIRCSGMVVCTGTGSTAWFDSISRTHADTVEDVLREANVAYDAGMVGEILQKLDQDRHFSPSSNELAYAVREPIVNDILACKRRRARGKRVSIRSLSWNGEINMDGVTDFPFNFGVQAVIEVGPPQTRLRSFRFDQVGRSQTPEVESSF